MSNEYICDFCGKGVEEVQKIFSAENAHICNECISLSLIARPLLSASIML